VLRITPPGVAHLRVITDDLELTTTDSRLVAGDSAKPQQSSLKLGAGSHREPE
jgi:hypothetical protein